MDFDCGLCVEFYVCELVCECFGIFCIGDELGGGVVVEDFCCMFDVVLGVEYEEFGVCVGSEMFYGLGSD